MRKLILSGLCICDVVGGMRREVEKIVFVDEHGEKLKEGKN